MNARVSLKESIGKAVSYGLAPGTIDRIGALAHAGRLGMLLWSWKYGGTDCEQEAGNLLTRRMAKRLNVRHIGEQKIRYMHLRLACRQVLREWYSPECDVCQGVKEVKEVHKRVVCSACRGSGERRYSNYERALSMKISTREYLEGWDKAFALIRMMITGKDAETARVVREQLKEDVRTVEVVE